LHNSPVATANREAQQQDPALRHHFVTAQQQKDAASLGMWVFLLTEIMFFGGMFCAYLVYRYWYFGDFAAGSTSLSFALGTTNTAVLICSSLTVAMAVRSAQTGKSKAILVYLVLTILLGLVFLAIKGKEYKDKFDENHIPGQASFHLAGAVPRHPDIPVNQQHAQIYFSLYFAMTGMHALHMLIGVGLFTYLTYKAWKGVYGPHYYTPLENGGLYWHFVDIIWIYLYPLLYLIDLHK
jgi:cytochrome c oxidase subunit III